MPVSVSVSVPAVDSVDGPTTGPVAGTPAGDVIAVGGTAATAVDDVGVASDIDAATVDVVVTVVGVLGPCVDSDDEVDRVAALPHATTPESKPATTRLSLPTLEVSDPNTHPC